MQKDNKAILASEIMEQDADGYPTLMYSKNKMPMMTDRENLCRITRKVIDEDTVIYVINSVEHPDKPRSKNAIRTDFFKGSRFKRVGNDIEYEEFATFDLGGYFPMSMLNMVMKSMISKGVEDFYKNVKDQKV